MVLGGHKFWQTVGCREVDRVRRSSENAMALWNELGEWQVKESSRVTWDLQIIPWFWEDESKAAPEDKNIYSILDKTRLGSLKSKRLKLLTDTDVWKLSNCVSSSQWLQLEL